MEQAPETATRQVGIGEIKAGSSGRLKATLGSCVGIVLFCRNPRMAALAHCLLPDSPPAAAIPGSARYVEAALPNLFAAMGLSGPARPKLRGVLCGGANALPNSFAGDRLPIGRTNLEAARRCLREHGIVFQEVECGGDNGCTIVVDCGTHEVTGTRLPELKFRPKDPT